MKAIEAEANSKFTKENMKTIQGQLDLWVAQTENWKGQRENVKKQIEYFGMTAEYNSAKNQN